MDKECQEIISDWISWVSKVSFKAHGGKKLGSTDGNGVFILNPDGSVKRTRGMSYTQHVKFSDPSWSFFDLKAISQKGTQWNRSGAQVTVIGGFITNVAVSDPTFISSITFNHAGQWRSEHRAWNNLKIPVPIDYVRISDFLEEMSVEKVNKESAMKASVKYLAARNVSFKSGADLKEFVKRISEFVKWNDYENKWPSALEFVLRASESEADEIVNMLTTLAVHGK